MAFFEVSDITKSFGKNEILKGIDFTLNKGEVLSIIGSSGSGKTTLLRCLNQLEVADTGKVRVNGETVFDAETFHSLKEKERRTNRMRFGLVFQAFNLFPQYTVHTNVALAPTMRIKEDKKLSKAEKAERIEAINKEASVLISKVGLADKSNFYPSQLSGGQQQRVAIARALALSPDILCFDEPTSALDPELTKEVLGVIKSLKSTERTMIIVTHEMEFARSVSDKIMFMAGGVIEEFGTADEVFNSPKSELTKAFVSKSEEF